MVLTGILVTKPKPDSSRTPYVLELETEPIRFWNFYDHSDEYTNWFIAVKPDGSVMELPDTVNYWAKEFSLNRKTAYWIDRNHVLYIITKNGCEKIADNVVCANISDTGNRIVYCVNDNLYLYDIAEKKSTEITSELSRHFAFLISPDGRSVAYMTKDGCHRYINGAEQGEPIRCTSPVAISDNGEYFYYNYDEYFYVIKNGGEPQQLGLEEDRCYYLNGDYSQMLYTSLDKTWLYDRGNKKFLSFQALCRPVLPAFVPIKEWELLVSNVNYDTCACSVGIDNFCELVYSTGEYGYGLSYLTKDMVFEEISPHYEQVLLSGDGNALLYSSDGDLYRVDKISSSRDSVLLGKNLHIKYFSANDNLSEIYYNDEYGDIMYLTEDGSKLVQEQDKIFASYHYLVVGDFLYFIDRSIKGGSLYVSKYGNKPEKFPFYENVTYLFTRDNTLYFETQKTDELYYIKDGKAYRIPPQ